MKPKRSKLILLGLAFIACGALYLQMTPAEKVQHAFYDHSHLRSGDLDSLFEGENAVFASAGKCDHCHGKDPEGFANVDIFGNDVNVVDDWSTSMMALSARDPYWRAKVSHEVAVNPSHQQELENLCTKCHAPMGNYAHQMTGGEHYSIEMMTSDEVALDGVSCLACHRQLPQEGEALHTGQLFFDPVKIAYGPYESPLITPMALYSSYAPEYGAHINDSKLCAGCHSLVTQSVDIEGNSTGTEFVEQATWHEWLNSAYPNEGVSCQSCHLPRLPKQAVHIATGFNTPAREPYGLHELVGGNALMLRLMKDNKSTLGIAATDEAFDETIEKTIDMLQNRTLTMQVQQEFRTADTLGFSVLLRNLGGHKLPSGYPARRMSVHVVVRNADEEIIFQSGGFTPNYEIIGEDATWEPHYQFIRNEDQVQIYEMVMGDVNGNRTTVLERGFSHLKDNRLVPRGFSTEHPQYDTTAVVLGVNDPDFGIQPGELSGTDRIHYRVPTNEDFSALSVEVSVYYQSVPPNWTTEMFTYDTPEINAFQQMFEGADKSPVLMKSAAFDVDEFVGINEFAKQTVKWTWLSVQQQLQLNTQHAGQLFIYDYNGKVLVQRSVPKGKHSIVLDLAPSSYIASFVNEKGIREVYRFVVSR